MGRPPELVTSLITYNAEFQKLPPHSIFRRNSGGQRISGKDSQPAACFVEHTTWIE
jgi:hypothetical protein